MTGLERDRYGDWDAAYVLGALSHEERLEYEEHLDDCARCSAGVAELGMMPGLLRLVPDQDAAAYDEEVPTTLAGTTGPNAIRPEPVRRRPGGRALALLTAAAAVAVLAAGLAVPLLARDHAASPAGRTYQLAALVRVPLRASVTLTPKEWGTEIAMTCAYTGEYGVRRAYALYVVDAAGHRQLVSRWSSGPGDTAWTKGSTDLTTGQISRVELAQAGGPVLLADTIQG